MNALDTALKDLAEASSLLEYTATPSLKDVEKARDKAKAAAKVLDAAFTLMSCGVYTVSQEPSEARYTDPAEHRIEMPEVATEIVAGDTPAELPQLPEELRGFDAWDEQDAWDTFQRRLGEMANKVNPDPTQDVDMSGWDDKWDEDHKDAFTRLLVAEARDPLALDIPSDEERDAWLAQFGYEAVLVAPDPEHLVEFRSWEREEQVQRFEALLCDLEDAGVQDGLKRKAWKAARGAWMDLFIATPETAWDSLWHAYHTLGCKCGFEIPTQEQIEEALAASEAEPAGDPMDESEGGEA